MHKIWIHHEYHKPTESPEYTPLFIYKQKDEPPPVAPTDLNWKKLNRDHCWHHIPWQYQNGLKRSCVCHQFATACALSTFGGDNGTVVVRRPHGGRMITCHYLPLLCDLTNSKQVFEHVQNLVLNLRALAITLVIAQMSYVWRTFTYVYLRSLAITCRNHP